MMEDPSVSDAPAEPRFLLGRLFVVPLIIVLVIVLCTVVVVVSFGAIASSREMPIARVLDLLEAGGGEKTAGMLMPRDKEMWQAAQELALRLENAEQEISAEDLPVIRSRLVAILRRDLDSAARMPRTDKQRLFFIMRATAGIGASEAVPLLGDALAAEDMEVRREALGALAMLGSDPAARALAPVVAAKLSDPEPVVRMVACAALSNLAAKGDGEVTQALVDAYLADDEQDVRWNAALTLARLGRSDSVPLVQQMLSRDYWEAQKVHSSADDGYSEQPMISNRVDDYLNAAIDAASRLDDETLWEAVEALTQDRSLNVVARAKRALGERPLTASGEG